jgi:phosphoglycerate dehydrogenase-like enzyme
VGRTNPVITIVTAPGEISPPGIAQIRDRAGEVRLAADRRALEEVLPGTDVLLVLDFRSPIVRDAWHAAHGVQWVHAASGGVDVIAFPDLADADVPVTNARGVFDRSIAEWVAGVALLFTKDLHTTLALQRQRRWQHRESGVQRGKPAL